MNHVYDDLFAHQKLTRIFSKILYILGRFMIHYVAHTSHQSHGAGYIGKHIKYIIYIQFIIHVPNMQCVLHLKDSKQFGHRKVKHVYYHIGGF